MFPFGIPIGYMSNAYRKLSENLNPMNNNKEECRCFYTETGGHTPIVDSRGFCKHGVKVGMDNNKEEVESFPGINSTSYSSMNPEFYAPQSPVSEEEKGCNNCDEEKMGMLVPCANCKEQTCVGCSKRRPNDYLCRWCSDKETRDSKNVPTPSEENWKLTANYWIGQFNGSQTDAVIAENLKSFIRSTRQEAQKELAEEMEKHMRLFSDSSHSNTVRFLFSKGLLPKITEDEV